MANFTAFSPEQQYRLLTKMGYKGPMQQDDMDKFMNASPSVASKVGKLDRAAQKIMRGERGFAEGGSVMDFNTWKQKYGGDMVQYSLWKKRQETSTESTSAPEPDTFDGTEVTETGDPIAQQAEETASAIQQVGESSDQLTQTALTSPADLASKAAVAQTDESTGQVDEDTGQIETPVQQAETETVDQTAQAEAPEEFEASTVDPSLIGDQVQDTLSDVEAAQGEVTEEMTVRGQLGELMKDFEDGTPPWAAGAMRQAMGMMQQRGLGASSMAGQAVVQAAMESALPIAMQDAKTYAQMEFQNLNNRQQTLIFKTQQTLGAMFSDQAAENAANQFNAQSENQVQQFFASLRESTSRFNAAQINAVAQFNAGQSNSVEMFNRQMQEAREQFNAQNAVQISMANAQLRTQIATSNTAAQNAANMQYAQSMTGLTAAAMDQTWQKERDLMTMAFTAAENQLDRDAEIAMAKLTAKQKQDYADSVGKGQILGTVVGELAGGIFDDIDIF